jgi:uncharacterized protein
MNHAILPLLAIALFAASALYSSVGHGGASAYLAIMGLSGMAPFEMKPIALALNIAVSTVALVHFVRAGHFRHGLFWPLAAASIPAAFFGGWLKSSDTVLHIILATALLAGAWRLMATSNESTEETRNAGWVSLLGIGGGIGFLSGLIGIGGGIFLTPLLMIFRWAPAKTAAAISAAFIAANSSAGISGFMLRGGEIPALTWTLLPCVLAGGWIGSRWGSWSAPSIALRRSLAAVLVIAAAKFVII